jgi:hypothetical protein
VQFTITRVASRGAPTVLIQNHPSVSTSTNLGAIGANIRYAAVRMLSAEVIDRAEMIDRT